MANTFLLVVILFVFFGLIHNEHQICEVQNLKIASVLDIKDDIKYFATKKWFNVCVLVMECEWQSGIEFDSKRYFWKW